MRQFSSQPLLLSKIHHHRKHQHCATEDPWHFLTHPEEIAGFFPENKEGVGTGVMVYLRDGKKLWRGTTMTTVLNRLADHYLINLTAMKKRLQLRLGMAYYLPLPLSKELVLVQVKTRHSTPESEGVHGYVNACQVKSTLVFGGSRIEDRMIEGNMSKGRRKDGGVKGFEKMEALRKVGEKNSVDGLGMTRVNEPSEAYTTRMEDALGTGAANGCLSYLEMECGLKFPCLTSQKKVNARFRQAQMAMDEVLE